MDNNMKKVRKATALFGPFLYSIILSSQRSKSFTILSCRTSFTLTNLQTNAQQNTDD